MAGPWEKYAAPAQDGPWAKYGKPQAAPEQQAAPEKPKLSNLEAMKATVENGLGFFGDLNRSFHQLVGNTAAGAVRGAGSIGATAVRPFESGGENDQRRSAMDSALSGMGAQPDSVAYGIGKLGAEVAGTSGVGGLLAKGAGAIPAIANNAPGVVNALRTAGMTTGASPVGFAAQAADLATRTGAGALVGGLSAGAINPSDTETGAIIGGAAPAAFKAVGAAGGAAGRLLRGPAQSPEVLAAAKQANDLGYVIPPTQVKPTLGNRILEGMSGKITTAQNASARNAGVTNKLAAKSLGLAEDTKLTPELLGDVRKQAGQAYDAIASSGTIQPGKAYSDALDKIAASHVQAASGFPNAKASPVIDLVDSLRSDAFDAGSAVAKIKELRSAADDAYRAGNTDVGRASKSAAKALEDAIESHLQASGSADMLQQFRDARQLIAKTYSVEKAMNATTGSVDARKLAAQLAKGKPLSGELKQAADFAGRFPKAAQTVEQMGSLPQTSPLDWHAMGAIGMATQNPLALAGVAARPAARSLVLSDLVQNSLARQQPQANQLLELLRNPQAQQLLYRAAPVIPGQ